jgi:outer membrane receptor protein involved in Fe transport
MGFEQYGGYLKLNYDINDHWKTYIDANVTHFNASYPGAENKPMYNADQWITRGVVSAALENHYGKTSGALSVYSNFGRHKIDDGTADPNAPTQRYFRSKDALTGVSLYQSIQLFDGNRVTAGVDYMHIYGNAYYTSKATGEILDTPNKQSGKSYRNEIAGYVDIRQDLLSWLTIDAGIRLDHHSVTGSEWVPQAGVVIRPISTGEMKAMVSKGFRNPSMREMYLYRSGTGASVELRTIVEASPKQLYIRYKSLLCKGRQHDSDPASGRQAPQCEYRKDRELGFRVRGCISCGQPLEPESQRSLSAHEEQGACRTRTDSICWCKLSLRQMVCLSRPAVHQQSLYRRWCR